MTNYYLKDGIVEVPIKISISNLKELTVIAQEKGLVDSDKIEWGDLLRELLQHWKNNDKTKEYYRHEFEERKWDIRSKHNLDITDHSLEVIASELAEIVEDS